ncbi:MAG: hypothetical protein ABIG11_08250 [bacterium]
MKLFVMAIILVLAGCSGKSAETEVKAGRTDTASAHADNVSAHADNAATRYVKNLSGSMDKAKNVKEKANQATALQQNDVQEALGN